MSVFFFFFSTLGLVIFGLLMIYNSSSFEAYHEFGDKYYYLKNQALWAIFGLLLLFLASIFPYKNLKKIALPLMIINLVLLLLVLVPGIGSKFLGARRWLSLGFFSFQPSELLKLTLSIYLASWLEERRPIWPFLFLTLLLLALILLQPDLGTAVIIMITAFLVYFISGASIIKLLFLAFIGAVVGILAIVTSEYRRHRILTFLNPSSDPLGTSYHLRQILIALGTGGLLGIGLGQSRQKYQYLPEATTDSIFAVIAEETGFFVSSVLILIYLFFVYLGFRTAARCEDKFGRLLASSLTIWLGAQAIINFGAMVSLIPLTGIPLPFISYGGSSLVVALTSVGILINIARQKR